jgi:hypothetical protein
MLIARIVIVRAVDSEAICDIGPTGGHRVHEASSHRLVLGGIAAFFIGHSLVKLYRNLRGNWSRLVHSALRQDRPNVAVLMDVDRVMLPIEFDVHA